MWETGVRSSTLQVQVVDPGLQEQEVEPQRAELVEHVVEGGGVQDTNVWHSHETRLPYKSVHLSELPSISQGLAQHIAIIC